jgi:hypothetical protein
MFFTPLRDQRRSARHWIATPVHILMGKSRIEGTTLNLSEHGMYMFTAANIALGSEIEIVFQPPEAEEPLQVSAIIRRKVVYLYGIEFVDRTDQTSFRPGTIAPDTTNPAQEDF